MTDRRWAAPALVALLALAASVTSLGHDFTFDDRYVIQMNGRVQSLEGMWRLFGQTYWPPGLGGDGYRPLVMSLFTLQWVAGGGAPWVFHLGNVVLAVAAALAVWWCAKALLPPAGALAAAALFAVHPVHVEVTGNVVGQSELIVALCLALAVGIYLRARRRGMPGPRDIALILALYAAGLFAKEHAIVLPAILLAAEWTLFTGPSWRERVRQGRLLALLLVLTTVLYLFVRGLVMRELAGFSPFPVFRYLRMSAMDRVLTMMTEMPRVARLLVFPTRLSADYSPSDVVVASGFDPVQLPGMFICLGVVLLAVVLRRASPVSSFGLLWLMIAFLPVSNFLVPTGFIVAERTLFFPSVGVVLVAGAVAAAVRARGRRTEWRAALAATGLLVALGVGRSVDRQRAWKNNDVLFEQLVKDVPNAYRAHFLRGRQVASHQNLREMELEYRRAIRLFPYDVSMMLSIANDYYRAGLCGPTVALLEWSYAVEPRAASGRYEHAECLVRLGRWPEARTQALAGLRAGSWRETRRMRDLLARADSAMGRRRKL